MAVRPSIDPLVWIDCEMTGLNPEVDTILSISCFVTDAQLNLIDQNGFDTIIQHSRDKLSLMDSWCARTHGESGLTIAATESTTTADKASQDLLAYVKKHVPQPKIALLAGNSVHVDQMFLRKIPFDSVVAHLHYRILDVSSIKEAIRRWAPDPVLQEIPRKHCLHQARADILESIEEARYYQNLIQKLS